MLFKNTVIYLIGRIIPSAINFALVALYTRMMAPAEYGKYAIVYASAIMGFNLGAMWLNMAAVRLYSKNEDKRPLLWALFVGFAAIMVLGLAFSLGLAFWYWNSETTILVALGFLLFAGMTWFELNLHLMQARLDAKSYTIQSVTRTAVGGFLGGMLAYFGWGAKGILIGMIVGLVLPSFRTSFNHWRDLRFDERHPKALREVLGYGIPLSMTFAAQSITDVTDRFLIQVMKGTAAVGLYAVGFDTAIRIILALSQPLAAASAPLAIARLESEGPEGARQQCAQNLIVLLLLTLPTCLGLVAVSPELVDVIVGPAYRAVAKEIMPIVSLTGILMVVRGNYLDHAFQLSMKPQRQIVSVSIVAVSNVILNVILIKDYGPVGAAYATFLAYAFGFLASFVLGRAVFRLPLVPGQVARIVTSAVVMLLVAKYLPAPGGPLAKLLVKTMAGGFVYILLITLFDVNGIRRHVLAFIQRGLLRGSR